METVKKGLGLFDICTYFVQSVIIGSGPCGFVLMVYVVHLFTLTTRYLTLSIVNNLCNLFTMDYVGYELRNHLPQQRPQSVLR